LSVQHRELTGGDGLLDPAPVAPQQLREGQAVRLGSDDQYRLAGRQARTGEMCDRVEEEPLVLIELHDVVAGRRFGEERIAPGRRFRERGLGGSFGGVNQMQACYFVGHGISGDRVSYGLSVHVAMSFELAALQSDRALVRPLPGVRRQGDGAGRFHPMAACADR